MSELWDAPNQQVVRPDASGPGDEGTGGSEPAQQSEDLGSLTKAQLLERADAQGVEADESMTKAQIIEALEAR
jgi:hypothetical protein